MSLKGVHDGGKLPAKHAAVPIESALLQEGLRRVQIRLFFEAQHGVQSFFKLFSCFDIAVSGGGIIRHDAKGDEPIKLRLFGGKTHGVNKCLFVLDIVVCRQDNHRRILRIAVFEIPHAERNAWRCIHAKRLDDDVFLGQIGQVALNQRYLACCGDDIDVFDVH